MAASATSTPSPEELVQLMQVIEGWEAMQITNVSRFALHYLFASEETNVSSCVVYGRRKRGGTTCASAATEEEALTD